MELIKSLEWRYATKKMNGDKIPGDKLERILEISEDAKQITLPDSRYYRRNGKYYPSITYVLSYYPKGKFFENWLKQVGFASEHIVKKAGEEGTQVHEMIEEYLNGKELNFLSPSGTPLFNPDVWQMFLRFVDFWEEYKPTLIEVEVHLFSDEIKVAGTCDIRLCICCNSAGSIGSISCSCNISAWYIR